MRHRYCQRLQQPTFWGGYDAFDVIVLSTERLYVIQAFCWLSLASGPNGISPSMCVMLVSACSNVELLVLSKMLRVPITVYSSQTEAQRSGGGFLPIAKYGEEYEGDRAAVSLLYRKNHYDLLTK